MAKRKFSAAERYAVWHCHQRRCWFCTEPLRLQEATIDHVIPESLLEDDARRAKVLAMYGLPNDFDINGFCNWLPCHMRCNQTKGKKVFEFVPAIKHILDKLTREADGVSRAALGISANAGKDEVFSALLVALEQHTITADDLSHLLGTLTEQAAPRASERDILLLEGGYWVHRDEIAGEGPCRCDREHCVDSGRKMYCYFRPDLSPWVITAGLYWKCYDEVIGCPRCRSHHKRGHTGRATVCGVPFRNQDSQTD